VAFSGKIRSLDMDCIDIENLSPLSFLPSKHDPIAVFVLSIYLPILASKFPMKDIVAIIFS